MTAAAAGPWTAHDGWLLAVAGAAMIAIVVLVTVAKTHPMLALLVGACFLGIATGLPPDQTLAAVQKGMGDTLGGVGAVIALGAMLGKLLESSGGAARIVERLTSRTGRRALPWAMAAGAMVVGVPMFFEVGVVMLVPIVQLVARRTRLPPLRVGIPALSGLSVLHALVPPHPAPLVAAALLGADVGKTLVLGLIVAVPTVAISGPLFGALVTRRARVADRDHDPDLRDRVVPDRDHDPDLRDRVVPDRDHDPDLRDRVVPDRDHDPDLRDRVVPDRDRDHDPDLSLRRAPSFGAAIATMLVPVALMMGRAAIDVAVPKGRWPAAHATADFFGQPLIALLVAVAVAVFALGFRRQVNRRKAGEASALLAASLGPVAGIILIVGAGGGFKQTLVASGVGDAIGKAAAGSALPPLLLGWLLAVAIRVATGSATVATLTAAGIMAALPAARAHTDPSFLALAIGCGSVFFSHVNDAGFWLVKEYFGLTVGETIASWSVMETLIAVVGVSCVLALATLG